LPRQQRLSFRRFVDCLLPRLLVHGARRHHDHANHEQQRNQMRRQDPSRKLDCSFLHILGGSPSPFALMLQQTVCWPLLYPTLIVASRPHLLPEFRSEHLSLPSSILRFVVSPILPSALWLLGPSAGHWLPSRPPGYDPVAMAY